MSRVHERVVILIRHGHTTWNLSNRFTGWTDIELSEAGVAEAAAAGRHLAAAGYAVDEAHVSLMRRTRQTVEVLAAAAAWRNLPIHASWRLNERHYGALQGMNKQEIFAAWGEEASRRWWRGYFEPPPALAWDDPRHPRFDPLYAGMDAATLPVAESLRDCQQRMLPYWRERILPALVAGRRPLLASHGNTLRGLVMELEQLEPAAMEQVEIPSGVPMVYRFDHGMALVSKELLN